MTDVRQLLLHIPAIYIDTFGVSEAFIEFRGRGASELIAAERPYHQFAEVPSNLFGFPSLATETSLKLDLQTTVRKSVSS